ncbi:aldehyde dehydrogenase [Nocardia suismassiliense]|uniref:aldehyde dehydrogenase n=1 Tax=Nocardia suismassiliense TaxID=2077092 RepID=UPI000D1E9147|nr:aldehyde dehydrogenase [Nocardia suismassiliense]
MSGTEHDGLFIGGQWVTGSGEARIEVVNPSTEAYLGSVPSATRADVDRAVQSARTAFTDPTGWATWTHAARAAAMRRLADVMERRGAEIAETVSKQNGMPISMSSALEAGFPPILLRMYADTVEALPQVTRRPGMLGGEFEVVRKPMGVVAAIVPWNFPQALAMTKIAPAIAAGNTVVLKPSPETVLDSIILAECLVEAEIPAGVVNIVPGGRDIGEHLVAHPGINRVAFTGSTAAGRSIAQVCGQLLRPVSLELGGKSAAIVLDDGDIANSIESLFGATLFNNGQTCYLSTRVLAPRSRYEEVVDTLAGLAQQAVVGDPLDPATMIGPMVSSRQRERVEGYIERGSADGAKLVVGGTRPDREGWFVSPAVFAGVDNNQELAREEVFGPVLAVISYDDEEQAVALANDSDFGLGGTVWSQDPTRARAFAERIETGTIGINRYLPDPAAPFGGIKASGIGRELGPEAVEGYFDLQTIYL